MYGVFNRGLQKLVGLEDFLGGRVTCHLIGTRSTLTATVGWGRRRYAKRAMRIAQKQAIPFICLEDGFLRSVGLGKDTPPLSIVADSVGIYYDATTPSQLEGLVGSPLTPTQYSRARDLITAWRSARVSKYNHTREHCCSPLVNEGAKSSRYVLVVDQTLGDASIRYGLAVKRSFHRMLDAALTENPDCTVLVKIHPDVFAGRKKGHFDPATLTAMPRVKVLGEDVHPVSLIEHSEAVYVVTSQMGFEGLLWGKRVRTFGMPFYAGWGLTEDELPAPERRKPVALENLIHAALVEYPRYIDPETGRRCEPERLIDWMGLQRRMRERFPALVYAVGFSHWKKPIVRDFFQGTTVRFVERLDQAPDEATVVVWGMKTTNPSSAPTPAISSKRHQVVRLEDGFLRSVGLGADLIRPLSWVMDSRGIYYDATRPSDMEHLLQTTPFDAEILARAEALRHRIVAEGLTKYNVGTGAWQKPQHPGPVILVPGQVETDASIAFGATGIRKNIKLLRAVREANPDAYVVYKPHPDVVAGLRQRGAGEDDASQWCDEMVVDCSMSEMLGQVDEVHVLTSLAGFEALLRGKRVVTFGQPFYSSWGLTEDRSPVARRTRRLSLDELVAGALLMYPTYVSRKTGKFTTPERALDELLDWRRRGASRMPLWRRGLRVVLRLLARA